MGKQSDEHYTPKWIFEELSITFDLDVAAPIASSLSNVPSKYAFTERDDGLQKDWFGNIWMNPPYSHVTPWVDKFIDHGNGIALLVVSRSKWFGKLWEVSDGIAPTPYNMKFDTPHGKPTQISFQTFLFALGQDNAKALKNLERRVR